MFEANRWVGFDSDPQELTTGGKVGITGETAAGREAMFYLKIKRTCVPHLQIFVFFFF